LLACSWAEARKGKSKVAAASKLSFCRKVIAAVIACIAAKSLKKFKPAWTSA
jgi:hypothetical protein